MTEKKMKKPNTLKLIITLLPNMYKASPILFVSWNIIGILHGITWASITFFTQRFFDTATQYSKGNVAISSVAIALLFLGLVHVVTQIENGLVNFLLSVHAEKARGYLSVFIHRKMSRLAPIDFEDVNLLDNINKAEQGKSNSIHFIVIFLLTVFFYIPYFMVMSIYLYSLKPIFVISIVIIFIPMVITQIIRVKVFAKLEDKSAPIRREFDYYETCLVSREYFKETRLLGGFSFFKNLYIDSLKLLNKITFKANMKANLFELSMKLVALCGYGFILYMLFDAMMIGEISIGAFAAVFSSLGLLFSIMEELISENIGGMSQGLGSVQNYVTFMDIKEREGKDIELPKDAIIKVDHISFTYPNAETSAINNVSFSIKSGETIAIVGENGSGKSTLLRLITGMYNPTSGNVFYNSISTKDISLQSIFKNMSAVFQKYQKYQMTLRENITISSPSIIIRDNELDQVCGISGIDKNDASYFVDSVLSEEEKNRAFLVADSVLSAEDKNHDSLVADSVLSEEDKKDDSYEDGYDTMLSREFGGIDISGGQWQRIAIARAFARSHTMIILDEPTAAIDPFEETILYKRFAEISKNKTAIIVTHRLGCGKIADRILVMHKGSLVEMGSHDTLMDYNGEYARMYRSQEEWYR